MSANPRSRPDPAKFLTQSRQPGGFLANDFVDVNLQLEEVQVSGTRQNRSSPDNVPDDVLSLLCEACTCE